MRCEHGFFHGCPTCLQSEAEELDAKLRQALAKTESWRLSCIAAQAADLATRQTLQGEHEARVKAEKERDAAIGTNVTAALLHAAHVRGVNEEREKVCAHVMRLRDEYHAMHGTNEADALDALLVQLACDDHAKNGT